MDFFKIVERSKRDELEIFPDFQTGEVTDILGRGKSFYAVWDEKTGLWSQNENDVQRIVDEELWKYVEDVKERRGFQGRLNVKTLKSDSSGMWNRFTQYMRRFPDSRVQLDSKLTFANTKTKKKDYASKRLSYNLEAGSHEAWDELMDHLYSPEEKEKIEWAIGAVVAGDSGKIEKFFVFYGDPGTGKGTVIKIIKKLFEGYSITFDAESLGTKSDQFSMEVFKSNPLVAVDPDGNLSRIDDNTRLNKIVSHEEVVINEKGKSRYNATMNCFIFIGSNSPVKMSDSKSGIRRRLVDISPTGKTFKSRKYDALMARVDFELGAIASHCLEVYRSLGKNYYKHYIPQGMIAKTDVFYNFIEYNLEIFEKQSDGMSLRQAYSMWKEYKDAADLEFKLPMHKFREELKNYYENFEDLTRIDGKQIRSWYSGFLDWKMHPPVLKKEEKILPLVMDSNTSLLDDILSGCSAQYAVDDGNGNEKPSAAWSEVTTCLRDIDTRKTHYVMPQKYDGHFVIIDFDLKNENGEKDILRNAEEASKWPPTYAEYSKGGKGIHLHYIYDGDISKLATTYAKDIEIKVFRGRAALRRRLSWCNDIPIAHLPEGALPFREEKMIDITQLKDELHLRNIIKKCLRKENHGATRPEIDLIKKVLEDAYGSEMSYDVSDLRHDVLIFAMNSTHQSDYCMKVLKEMKFKSKDIEAKEKDALELEERGKASSDNPENRPFVFYDIEVKPNLVDVGWCEDNDDDVVHFMRNPKPSELEEFFKLPLIDFNGRKYDRHILWHRYLGNSIESCYDLSKRIIVEQAKDAFYPEAYNLGVTDIYDFASKKQSLKKWEVEMGFHHQELGLPWDEPVTEDQIDDIEDYCKNDVLATKALFHYLQGDWTARQILADISGGSVNNTTNQLTTKFIRGSKKKGSYQFNYRNMGDMSDLSDIYDDEIERLGCDPEYTKFNSKGMPIFPGYKYEFGQSTYREEIVGEGGYVYAEPGIHVNIPTQDVSGQHPTSLIKEILLGEDDTKRFEEIVQARIFIKHKDYESARKLLDGKLEKYLSDESQAKQLANALKIVVNSVYGLTSAKFDNPFRDPRNKDNIVAKRGALFMINLKYEIQRKGFTVVHCKTDSIKVENATEEIIQFIRDYGKLYGYSFDTEAEYERLCLVNDAVYIAYEKNEGWTATGKQFQEPYVFKTLFSGEPVEFGDYCEIKEVKSPAEIYIDMNELLPDVSEPEKTLKKVLKDAGLSMADLEEGLDKLSVSKELKERIQQLQDDISVGHNYRYIGRVGHFVPIKNGCGGGRLMVKRNGKFDNVTGTKGYRWLESEAVRKLGKENDIDISYHQEKADAAIATIEKFGSFERFIDTDRPYIFEEKTDDPPWYDLPPIVPCGDSKYNTCLECVNCKNDICEKGYDLTGYVKKSE